MKTAGTVVALVTALVAGHAHARGPLADLSVYDRSEGRRLPVYRHEGRAYIVGKPGHGCRGGAKAWRRPRLFVFLP